MLPNFRYAALLGVLITLQLAEKILAADPANDAAVMVQLTDGRKFTGAVDQRTNEEALWLRFASGTAYVQRAIAWEKISAATSDGKTFDALELKEKSRVLATAAPRIWLSDSAPEVIANPRGDVATAAYEEPVEISQLTTMDCDAWLANWDADVEPDGVMLEVRGRNSWGERVPLEGSVEAILWGPVKHAFHERPQSAGIALDRLETWRLSSHEGKVTSHGLLIKLPFGSVHPDFVRAVGSYGALQVKVVVPGSGVFHDTIDPLQIRTFSPIRETFRRGAYGRFLPLEGTGRGIGAW